MPHEAKPLHRLIAEIGLRAGGFDRQLFAQMLGMIGRFDDQDFIDYGLKSAQITAMRGRYRAWQAELQSSSG